MAFRARRPHGGGPLLEQEATDCTSKNQHPEEAEIPTENEPTGSEGQDKPEQHLAGPPLGEKPQNTPLRPGRAQARRLLETARDELVRVTVQASVTGLAAVAVYWFERR